MDTIEDALRMFEPFGALLLSGAVMILGVAVLLWFLQVDDETGECLFSDDEDD